MSDPEAIYLQPECCADPSVGRLWCEDDAPVDCEEGKPWTKYVRADLAEQQAAEIERLRALLSIEHPEQRETVIKLAMRCITHCLFSRASGDKTSGEVRAAIVTLFGPEVDAEIEKRIVNRELKL
jgi:hypothetical protein